MTDGANGTWREQAPSPGYSSTGHSPRMSQLIDGLVQQHLWEVRQALRGDTWERRMARRRLQFRLAGLAYPRRQEAAPRTAPPSYSALMRVAPQPQVSTSSPEPAGDQPANRSHAPVELANQATQTQGPGWAENQTRSTQTEAWELTDEAIPMPHGTVETSVQTEEVFCMTQAEQDALLDDISGEVDLPLLEFW